MTLNPTHQQPVLGERPRERKSGREEGRVREKVWEDGAALYCEGVGKRWDNSAREEGRVREVGVGGRCCTVL